MTHQKVILSSIVLAIALTVTAGGSTLTRGMEGGRTGMPEAQKEQVEQRKAAIAERIDAKKAEITERLADKRLAACEKRQGHINTIFTKATEQNKKQLAVFQKIEENVKAFYASKNLTAEGYDAAIANADDKEAVAVAAIEASAETTFDCSTTDAAKPGSAIKEAMTSRHAALKDYRTAIKDLILVVKKHNGQQVETTTKTDTTTEGAQ